jgi:hypothetical protein
MRPTFNDLIPIALLGFDFNVLFLLIKIVSTESWLQMTKISGAQSVGRSIFPWFTCKKSKVA